jgi:hypothetical protein
LESGIIPGTFTSGFVIRKDKRDPDLEIGEDLPMSIRKTGTTNTASICLGAAMKDGIHTFTVKIESLTGNGWIGLGFIEKDEIILNVSNYTAAICTCTDQSQYNLHVNNKVSMAAGQTWTFVADFTTGDIKITSDNGFDAVAIGYKERTLYPYFEFTSKHHITVLSYNHEVKDA